LCIESIFFFMKEFPDKNIINLLITLSELVIGYPMYIQQKKKQAYTEYILIIEYKKKNKILIKIKQKIGSIDFCFFLYSHSNCFNNKQHRELDEKFR